MFDKSCIKKIGIFRALQLGDLLCSIPAIRALRHEFVDAEIFLIGLPSSKDIVYRFPHYFNGLIKFPGYPGLPEQPFYIQQVLQFIDMMQKHKFDLIIQMQGNGSVVNPLVELFGARYTAGFYRTIDYKPDGGLFIPYPEGHEIERHLALMKHLGIQPLGKNLEFPITTKDIDDFEATRLSLEPGNYVCVHPGSRGSWRQWEPANFARLADYCHEKQKQVVITGTKEELPVAEKVAAHMKHSPLIVSGKTTLGMLGVLIKNAFAIISNCTGISHMASALETPGVIISMDGEPDRWAPLNTDKLFTLDWLTSQDIKPAENALVKLFE